MFSLNINFIPSMRPIYYQNIFLDSGLFLNIKNNHLVLKHLCRNNFAFEARFPFNFAITLHMGSNQAESSNFCCDSKRGSSVGNAGGVAERVLNQPLVEIAKMNAKKTDHTGDDCASKYATGENIEMEELADSQPPDDSSFFEDLSVKENPFSLILPRDVSSVCETEMHHGTENLESSYELLQSGMVLLQNYVGISDQVEIVKACEALGGFYQPGYRNGGKLKLHMMCLGRAWDPQTRYNKIDGSRAPPAIPDKLTSFVKRALQDSQESKDELPSMSPDICIVNFYSTAGGLGLHQDRDKSIESLRRGLPVVSISIGDAAEFLYGDERDLNKAKKVVLGSGDVLIFGGKSRLVFHGVKSIVPSSAPLALVKECMLRPGRLNLTFRQF